jgi:hypothetical protein
MVVAAQPSQALRAIEQSRSRRRLLTVSRAVWARLRTIPPALWACILTLVRKIRLLLRLPYNSSREMDVAHAQFSGWAGGRSELRAHRQCRIYATSTTGGEVQFGGDKSTNREAWPKALLQ